MRVALTAQVREAVDRSPRTHILSVRSNRPGDRAGRDWIITGDLTLSLRAERSRGGAEHVYTITVESRDASGNASTKAVVVPVSHRFPKPGGGGLEGGAHATTGASPTATSAAGSSSPNFQRRY